ncbi:MAG: glycyl-radical enzyme activating protein [Christensenellaceae bacterium]|nr:glycyl-radical enzyme activating protein [Christensenellaceae bacterium]
MNSIQGVIFDIKEFSVNDGPGVRQTVFLKGCPLRCAWCHNPEGLETVPQLLVRYGACIHCGLCKTVCKHDPCIACGDCITVCPLRLRTVCGETITAEALAARLAKNAGIYAGMKGGITFSGGEPLMQPQFLLETMRLTRESHRAVETSGFAPRDVFLSVAEEADLIMMDIKLVDPLLHRRYTGVDNDSILLNLRLLIEGDTPFIIRIPLIPGVNDNTQNLHASAELLRGARSLQYVELLPYNRLAGAKYRMLDRSYEPDFDTERSLNVDTKKFDELGIKTVLL